MRACANCRKQDEPRWSRNDCTCEQTRVHDDDPSPLKHSPDCNGIEHEVAAFYVRLTTADLTWDKQLPRYYAQRGWVLRLDGGRFYRAKLLCTDCRIKEELAQDFKADYERACKASSGQPTMTYAQMLANQ